MNFILSHVTIDGGKLKISLAVGGNVALELNWPAVSVHARRLDRRKRNIHQTRRKQEPGIVNRLLKKGGRAGAPTARVYEIVMKGALQGFEPLVKLLGRFTLAQEQKGNRWGSRHK